MKKPADMPVGTGALYTLCKDVANWEDTTGWKDAQESDFIQVTIGVAGLTTEIVETGMTALLNHVDFANELLKLKDGTKDIAAAILYRPKCTGNDQEVWLMLKGICGNCASYDDGSKPFFHSTEGVDDPATACKATEPPTAPPTTAVPATTVPATTVPTTTVPATTVPATTVPATTVPATTVPATTKPVTTPAKPATKPETTKASNAILNAQIQYILLLVSFLCFL